MICNFVFGFSISGATTEMMIVKTVLLAKTGKDFEERLRRDSL